MRLPLLLLCALIVLAVDARGQTIHRLEVNAGFDALRDIRDELHATDVLGHSLPVGAENALRHLEEMRIGLIYELDHSVYAVGRLELMLIGGRDLDPRYVRSAEDAASNLRRTIDSVEGVIAQMIGREQLGNRPEALNASIQKLRDVLPRLEFALARLR